MHAAPILSPRDHEMLTELARGRSLREVVADHELSALDLLDWFDHPRVREHLGALCAVADLALHLTLTAARSDAIHALAHVARTAKETTERRRAATTLMRGVTNSPCPREGARGMAQAPSFPLCGQRGSVRGESSQDPDHNPPSPREGARGSDGAQPAPPNAAIPTAPPPPPPSREARDGGSGEPPQTPAPPRAPAQLPQRAAIAGAHTRPRTRFESRNARPRARPG